MLLKTFFASQALAEESLKLEGRENLPTVKGDANPAQKSVVTLLKDDKSQRQNILISLSG